MFFSIFITLYLYTIFYILFMLYLIPIFIFLDYISKYIANSHLSNQINLLSDFVYLKLVKNPWIAFSINFPFLKIITVFIIIWIIFYFIKYEKNKNNSFINLSFALIIWWALWNARERILFSWVTDFIWVKYFSIFNFADIFLTLWVILYLGLIILKKDNDWI